MSEGKKRPTEKDLDELCIVLIKKVMELVDEEIKQTDFNIPIVKMAYRLTLIFSAYVGDISNCLCDLNKNVDKSSLRKDLVKVFKDNFDSLVITKLN
jgi:hypothetical protein